MKAYRVFTPAHSLFTYLGIYDTGAGTSSTMKMICPLSAKVHCGDGCPLFSISSDERVVNLHCGIGRKIILGVQEKKK